MSGTVTPARQQYLEIKAAYPDAIVWFRLGDFYEMFDQDAIVASSALRITLTSRSFGKDCKVPMCGVPHHAQARFLARLVRQGHNVAICEQMSPPGHGLVDRKVIRVVTPGTIAEPELLQPGQNNYLAAVARCDGWYALAYADVSTGEFRIAETLDVAEIVAEMEGLAPAECLVDDPSTLPPLPARHITTGDAALWQPITCVERLRRHLDTASLHIAGVEGRPAAQAAAGAILGYLERTNRALLNGLQKLRPCTLSDAVNLDPATRACLLGRMQGAGDRAGSLLGVLDRTLTAMGTRVLARWLRRPLRDLPTLTARQDAIAELLEAEEARVAIRRALRGLADFERLTVRVGQERATSEELLALCTVLDAVPALHDALRHSTCSALRAIAADLDPAADIAAGVRAAVAEPGSERLIRPGFDAEIDLLAAQSDQARQRLAGLELAERARTGIRSLKVAYNQVFGYYIEISKPNLSKAPPDYVRKQTLAHSERFVCAELLHWEAMLAEADAKLEALDRARFLALQQSVTAEAPRLLATADAMARLDVLCALADVADDQDFSRPELVDTTELVIRDGRHPMVEVAIGKEGFIPNDCLLGGPHPTLAVVTGPNMGGKSTYLRQVALIVYMAQIGSFVPARQTRIGLADRIFTRVGAQDNLAAGQSTFLIEMAETAAIVRLATPRSLVLLDEIGRGTTSVDGLAIARAVAEHLHEVVEARTLFATHYYELARAADVWPRACNLHMTAQEHEHDVVFLYRVAPGAADKSFALHVARMAGMPAPIIHRAADLVAQMSEQALSRQDPRGSAARTRAPDPGETADEPIKLHVAEPPPGAEEVLDDLLQLDLAGLTPIAALNALHALQQAARATLNSRQAQTKRTRGYLA